MSEMLPVSETFRSIQGEGKLTGVPSFFVRLSGCNLRCRWCDTPYAFHEGRKLSVDEVVAQVLAFDCPVVEITGGEPLLQADVVPLMERLLALGKTVMVETGGHRPIGGLPADVIRIMDVKCPGSGEADRNDPGNLALLTTRDQVKFVIADRADYEFARDLAMRERLAERCGAVLFSPVHGELPPRQLAEWILQDRLPVRLQLQVHKHIWDPATRGV